MNGQVFRNPALGHVICNDIILTAHSSEQIKGTLGRYGVRDQASLTIDSEMLRDAEEYKTQQRLALAHARNLTCIAHQCTTFRQDCEAQLLLRLVDSGGEHTQESACSLAILARDTLKAEQDLLISELGEYQVTVSIIQDKIEEACSHLKDAKCQVENLLAYLNDQRITPITFEPSHPTLPTLSPSVLAMYQTHLRMHLPRHWKSGTSILKQSTSGPDDC